MQWGAVLTLVGVGVSVVTFVALHILPTGIRPLRDPVSQYRLTRYSGVAIPSTLFNAVAGIGAIIALTAMLGAQAIVTDVLVGLFVLARLLIPFLPMDAPGASVTAVGRIHNLLAFVGFGAVTAAAYVGGGALHDGGFPIAASWSTVCAIVMSLGAVGILVVLVARKSLFGLFERIIYVGFFGWYVLIGVIAATA